MKKYIFFLSLCLLLPTAFVFSQPGSLDSSFSNDGLIKSLINGGTFASSIAVQNDGKIVIAGRTNDGSLVSFGLVRYSSNGIPDKTFGIKGVIVTRFSTLYTTASSILTQSNGTIVVGGRSSNGLVMARYKKNGTLDSAFGINGKIISDFGGNDEGAFSLALQTDGKIVAAGTSDKHFAVARYKQNGTRDSTFGTNGLITTSISNNSTNVGRGVALQSDGKIVVSGFTYDKNGNHDAVLLRYKKNGQLDNSFGNGGITITDLGSANDVYTSISIKTTGKVIVAGYTGPNTSMNFVVAQYKKDGTLDSSFGDGGITITDFENSYDQANSVALQADGKIILAGFTLASQVPYKFALVRYDQDGTVDSSFGDNGKVITDFGGNAPDKAYAMAMQSDNKILVAGGSGEYAAVARYNSDSSNLHFAKNIITNIKTNKISTISLSPNPVKDILYLKGMSTNKKPSL